MQPLIETDALAGVLFWTALAVWGGSEWLGLWRERRAHRRRGDRWSDTDRGTGAFCFVMIEAGFVLGLAAGYLLTWAAIPGPRWLWLALGLVLIFGGLALRHWAIRTLGRFFTRDVRIQEGHALVTEGPYRVVRHPSYLGGAVSAAGFGLALGNWMAILLALACSLSGIVRRIGVEEDVLRRGLGPGVYASYAARRSRLVPGVW